MSFLLIHQVIFCGYILQLSCQTVLRVPQPNQMARNPHTHLKVVENQKSATSSMLEHAKMQIPNANINMSVKDATNWATQKKTVQKRPDEIYGLQSKYLCHNFEESSTLSPMTSKWSEQVLPLLHAPLSETLNPFATKTITDNPDLFQVNTPINVDVFEALLKTHQNPKFVDSVCAGLCKGFWPWADTLHASFPITHDESCLTPDNNEQATFIQDQCLKEHHKGYYLNYFGTKLLPGMYSMPIHAIPKPNSTDLRLVTDHSTGPFSLNSMINCTQVTGFPLDNLHHLGEMLLDARRSIGNVPLTLWKSDISDAYRLLPMNPYWQLKQVITIDGQCYVDWNLAFGSSGSPAIFISFNSLVAWIIKYIIGVDYISNYVDNSSGCNFSGDTLFYAKYVSHLLTL